MKKRQRFFDYFPPPSFLVMEAIGLDIAEDAVRFIELKRHSRGFTVGRFGTRPLPPGTMREGEVLNRDGLLQTLRSLREEAAISFVRTALTEEKAYLFKTRIPHAAVANIRQTIESTLEERVPIAARDAVFDYTVVKENHPPADHLDMVVSALPLRVSRNFSILLKEAGLTPLSIEIEAEALRRAVVALDDYRTTLLVNLREAHTGLYIVSDGVTSFTQTVHIDGRSSTAVLKKGLGMSLEKVREFNHTRVEERGTVSTAATFSALAPTFATFKDELHKLLVYWETHPLPGEEGGRPIERMILCGRDAVLPGFDEYLAAHLKLEVVVGNVWQNVCSFDDYLPPIPYEEALDFGVAVGLALPVNILP